MDSEQLVALARVRDMCRSGVARAIREAHHLTIREIAEAAHDNPSTIYRYETNARQPRGEAALRYEAVLARLLRERGRNSG